MDRTQLIFPHHAELSIEKALNASCFQRLFAQISLLSAQFTHTHQLFSSHPQVRHGEQCGQLSRVFHQPTKTHFHVTEMALDPPKRMLDLGTCPSFAVSLLHLNRQRFLIPIQNF